MIQFKIGEQVHACGLHGVVVIRIFNLNRREYRYVIKTSGLTLYNVYAKDIIPSEELEVGDKVTANDKVGIITKKVSNDLYRINFNPAGIEEISKIYLTKVEENYNV